MKNKLFLFCLFLMLASACQPLSSPPDIDTPPLPGDGDTVMPLPSPSASPALRQATPSQPTGLGVVNIYLVAVGDNGASGVQIGCGDSLVPVEVKIEPTLGVLRAALNELLKLEGQREYGQSGLYNALYLSDLSITDVAVIEREAIIQLEGELVFGGECDIPRIEEQLRALALQFNTVERVNITVNGQALEDLLDLRG